MNHNRLYLSTFINTFGSWLTFIAIALLTKEKYGAQEVAWVFLVQTLPAIFFSRSLSSFVHRESNASVYSAMQILLAANSLLLVFNQSLAVIYVHLFIAATLKAVSSPLYNSLLGEWIRPDDQKTVFTKIGAIQAGTLALAPVAGAWIKIAFSAKFLFALDAVTFIIALGLLKELFGELLTFKFQKVGSLLATLNPQPIGLPKTIRHALMGWFAFWRSVLI